MPFHVRQTTQLQHAHRVKPRGGLGGRGVRFGIRPERGTCGWGGRGGRQAKFSSTAGARWRRPQDADDAPAGCIRPGALARPGAPQLRHGREGGGCALRTPPRELARRGVGQGNAGSRCVDHTAHVPLRRASIFRARRRRPGHEGALGDEGDQGRPQGLQPPQGAVP